MKNKKQEGAFLKLVSNPASTMHGSSQQQTYCEHRSCKQPPGKELQEDDNNRMVHTWLTNTLLLRKGTILIQHKS